MDPTRSPRVQVHKEPSAATELITSLYAIYMVHLSPYGPSVPSTSCADGVVGSEVGLARRLGRQPPEKCIHPHPMASKYTALGAVATLR